MTRDHQRERRFTLALAAALAGTLVLSAATAIALRTAGASRVLAGRAAQAGTQAQSSGATAGGAASGGSSAGNAQPAVQGSAGQAVTQGVSNGVIHLGSIVTQTGPGRSTTMAHALVAWEKTVNDAGGINGLKVSIDIKDDQGNPDLGASEYRQLNEEEKVFAMVGECAPITDAQEVDYIRGSSLPMVGECQSSPAAYTLPTMWVAGPTPYQNGVLGADLMLRTQGWPGSGGHVALVCLQDPSTSPVCDGAGHTYPGGALWHGGPQYEQITDNNYSQLIAQWQADGVSHVHLVLDPGSVQRYLYAAQNAGFTPATMNNLVVDDGVGRQFKNAEGMMIGTPWAPLDSSTPEMARFRGAMQRYYPDDRVDLYAQTGWVSALLLEHALRLIGPNLTRQALIDTLNTKFVGWDTQFGPVESFSPQVHNGPLESALMAVAGAGSAAWRLHTIHGAISG